MYNCFRLNEHIPEHTERKPLYGLDVQRFWQLPKASYLGVLSDTRNEQADNLTEKAIIDYNHTLDPATVIQCVTQQLVNFRPESTSYTLSF